MLVLPLWFVEKFVEQGLTFKVTKVSFPNVAVSNLMLRPVAGYMCTVSRLILRTLAGCICTVFVTLGSQLDCTFLED